jgi:hypothetical protein
MNSLDVLVTIAALSAFAGVAFVLFGLLVTWLQRRRLGWSLHAVGAASLATSAFVLAALQAAFHMPHAMVGGDFVAGVLFATWMVLAARAAYRSPALTRAV